MQFIFIQTDFQNSLLWILLINSPKISPKKVPSAVNKMDNKHSLLLKDLNVFLVLYQSEKRKSNVISLKKHKSVSPDTNNVSQVCNKCPQCLIF